MNSLFCDVFFVDPSLMTEAADAVQQDFEKAVAHVKWSLIDRFGIDVNVVKYGVPIRLELRGPVNFDSFDAGSNLRGIARYLTQHGKAVDYKKHKYGTRLLYILKREDLVTDAT